LPQQKGFFCHQKDENFFCCGETVVVSLTAHICKNGQIARRKFMTTEQQIPVLLARLVEYQSVFNSLPTEDAQWLIQNTKEAIAVCIEAIKNRPKFELLLEPMGTVIISARTEKFVARDHFIVDKSKKAKVKISYLGENFTENFLGKIEDPFVGSILRYGKLKKYSVDAPIISELGGEAKAETTLAETFSLMEKQGNGGEGDLLTNGYANIFYIRGERLVLWAVDCRWLDGGWSVYANPVTDPRRWSAGRRVFSRSSSES